MAPVTDFQKRDLQRDGDHTAVDCTYAIIHTDDGDKMLQLDTYGSRSRKMPGKVSQSLRFSPEAIVKLKKLLNENF